MEEKLWEYVCDVELAENEIRNDFCRRHDDGRGGRMHVSIEVSVQSMIKHTQESSMTMSSHALENDENSWSRRTTYRGLWDVTHGKLRPTMVHMRGHVCEHNSVHACSCVVRRTRLSPILNRAPSAVVGIAPGAWLSTFFGLAPCCRVADTSARCRPWSSQMVVFY